MSTFALIIIFSVLSGVFSLAGGVALLGREDWVRRFAVHFVSFAAGTLLAGAFLDLLPEALSLNKMRIEILLGFVLGGVVLFFIVERVIYKFHGHYYEDSPGHVHATPLLLTFGDAIHNFIDGVIIASAFLVSIRLGVVTALAVAAHELPQEISDFSIMLHHGWSKGKVLWTNFGVSLTNILGAIMTYAARDILEPALPAILAITAGIFIYIATADLFPELSPKTSLDKTSHILALLFLGIASVVAISKLLNL